MLDWIQGIFDAVYTAYLEVVESTVVAADLCIFICAILSVVRFTPLGKQELERS